MLTLKEKGIIAMKDVRDKLRQASVIDPERTDDELDAEAEILEEVVNNTI